MSERCTCNDMCDSYDFVECPVHSDACPHCGYVEVNRFGTCASRTCYSLTVAGSRGWQIERDRGLPDCPMGGKCEGDCEPGCRDAVDTLRDAHVDACKCGRYEPGADGVCRWCHT